MPETTVPVDRPQIESSEVRHRAAVELCRQMGGEYDTQDTAESLAKVLRYGAGAYELAQALDHQCWSIDDSIVEALLEADGAILQAHQAIVTDWVAARRIRPLRGVGAAVTVSYRGKTVDGEIRRIDAATGNYVVCCPDLGHVLSGPGPTGIIVPFEAVHGLCPGPETFELEPAAA